MGRGETHLSDDVGERSEQVGLSPSTPCHFVLVSTCLREVDLLLCSLNSAGAQQGQLCFAGSSMLENVSLVKQNVRQIFRSYLSHVSQPSFISNKGDICISNYPLSLPLNWFRTWVKKRGDIHWVHSTQM